MQTSKIKKIMVGVLTLAIITNIVLLNLSPISIATTTEIGTEYEIKAEEEWDASVDYDEPVQVKWTLSDKTITVSGTGKVSDVFYNDHWKYKKVVEKIIIKDGIKSIPASTFENCNNLKVIKVSADNKYYISVDGVLYNKGKTKIIGYPRKKQGAYTIPSGVTSIREKQFYDCKGLTSIKIPDTVKSIGEWAFYGCSSLKNANIPSSVMSIGGYAFSGCSNLRSVNIPSGVTSLGNYAFSACSSLTSVNISSGLKNIGNYAFSECNMLKSIEFPNTVKSIGEWAFGYGLKSIKIPSSVTSIGEGTFFALQRTVFLD